MGLIEIIRLCILICVCILIYAIVCIPAWVLGIGYPWLPPEELTRPLWTQVERIMLIFLVVFLVVCWVLYEVYQVLSRTPFIGDFVDDWTPFRELIDTGVFNLFDSIFYLIYCYGLAAKAPKNERAGIRSKGWQRLRGALEWLIMGTMESLQGYVPAATEWLRSRAYGGSYSMTNAKGKNGAAGATGAGGSSKPAKQTVADKLLTQAERDYVRDSYMKCVRERVVYPTPEDNAMKRTLLELKNQLIRNDCKIDNIKEYANLIMASRR